MRRYQNADGLIVQSDKKLKWDGWQEVTSASSEPVRPKKEEVAPAQQKEEITEPQDNIPADDDDSDLDVPEEPKRGKRK